MSSHGGLGHNYSALKSALDALPDGEAAGLSLKEQGDSALRTLQKENTVSYNRFMDLLQGGTGGYDDLLRDEEGRIIRHRQELMALTLLLETVHYLAHEPKFRAVAITNATFERYMEAHETTDDGQERRWLEDDGGYKRTRLVQYPRACDRGKFRRFLNQTADKEEEWQTWSGEASAVTKNFVRFALAILSDDIPDASVEELREHAAVVYHIDVETERLDEALQYSSTTLSPTPSSQVCTPPRVASGEDSPSGTHRETRYPTASEVREVAQILHPEREAGYHEEVLKKLQREGGEVKMAFCPEYENGERYVYYPQHLPDPKDARDVWVSGEKQDPEPAPSDDATEAEHPLMTDGGTQRDDPMSTQTTDTSDTTATSSTDRYSEKELRQRFPEVVRGRTKQSSVLHLPDSESDAEEPMCDRYSKGEWRRTEVVCFPPGWRSFCQSCRERLREKDRVEEPDQYGNALLSEWA